MKISEVLVDSFGRVREVVGVVLDDVTPAQLTYRADPGANTVAWLVWHLTRVQDDHVSEVAGHEQVWTSGGWADRFGLPFSRSATGYGQSNDEVGRVRVDAGLLLGYHEAVFEMTCRFLENLREEDLDRVVDERWDPPVTLGVRLVSVIADDLQHAGQAALIKGIAARL